MQISSKMLYKTAIMLLSVLMVLGVFLAIDGATQRANAMDSTEWATVANAINDYVTTQYVAADDGEAGFLLQGGPYTGTGTTLKDRIDSNNNGVILGEGDDAANAPVLVDVRIDRTKFIPGTSLRTIGSNTWRDSADAINAPAIADKVADHRTAGFSTDIVSYCVSGHTQSPPIMAWGAMSAAGYFGSPHPKVLDLKWGRLGWGGNAHAPSYANTLSYTSSLATPTTSALATNTACTGEPTDAELVRCTADVALSQVQLIGPWAATDDSLYQPVDLRSSITNTIADQTTGGAYAIQVPLETLFNPTGGTWDNLAMLDSSGARNIVFMNRTQHTAGMVAQGARMLGYQADSLKWGLPKWNSATPPAWPEQFDLAGRGYDYPMLDATAGATVDTTAPTITAGPTAAVTSDTSADISRTTDEPATTKVEYGTTSSGPYTTTVNDTVLHATNTVSLTGLTAGTTYYAVVTVCDGNANCTVASEVSFTTCGQPNLSLGITNVYWATMADYTAGLLSIDYNVGNGSSNTAYNVALSGSTATNGVTVSSGIPASIGTIAGGGSSSATVKYDVPGGVGSFWLSNTATADDACGNGYTYP